MTRIHAIREHQVELLGTEAEETERVVCGRAMGVSKVGASERPPFAADSDWPLWTLDNERVDCKKCLETIEAETRRAITEGDIRRRWRTEEEQRRRNRRA